MKYLILSLFVCLVFTQPVKAIEVIRGEDADYVSFTDGTPLNFPLNWDEELETVTIGFPFIFFDSMF